MKILHINYSDKSGGAGIAAYRHNEAMNRIGLNSNMLVVLKMTRDNTIYVLRKNRVQLQVLDNLYNFLHSFVISLDIGLISILWCNRQMLYIYIG